MLKDDRAKSASSNSPAIPEAIGESEAFLEFRKLLSRAAKVDRPILVIGERGTGKELAAARLHYHSNRWSEPLVALDCAALTPTLIESELFGYEAGAFTGAAKKRIGRFEAADGGTLFLDEIGNIPLEVQSKILRVVEYQSFERVGSSSPTAVDVRIIGATNANLPELADEGRFKWDLLDRLSFEVLEIPPLRERKGDITLLANHFAVRIAYELHRKEIPEFSPSALGIMEEYPWPGNVRELKNVVERSVYRSDTHHVEEIVFNPFPKYKMKKEKSTLEKDRKEENEVLESVDMVNTLADEVEALERRLLKQALEKAKYKQKKAADILGLTYHQFRGLYRKYGGSELSRK